MLKTLLISARSTLILSILTGVLYPLLVTLSGQLLFSAAANGSLIQEDDKFIGSSLVAQKFTQDRYFQSRPSASDYGTLPSGASNLSPTSLAWKDVVSERQGKWGGSAPSDLLTSSGSGLDPHISRESALHQADRVALARGIQIKDLKVMIDAGTEEPLFGFIGMQRVNVLRLNLALDKKYE